MKWCRSILFKYMLVVGFALMFVPVTYFPIITGIYSYMNMTHGDDTYDTKKLEVEWHEQARKLVHADNKTINETIKKWKRIYPKASMFWVDKNEKLAYALPKNQDIPDIWDGTTTLSFVKSTYNRDPFTVIAFIGDKEKAKQFMVLQVPRKVTNEANFTLGANFTYIFIIGFIALPLIFIIISFFLFSQLRKRIVRLTHAMKMEDGLFPNKIIEGKQDEIGRLEGTFNKMVDQLYLSRVSEEKESSLRKDVIARLSHDLRTPLTTIRGHVYALQSEQLSDAGNEHIELIDYKITYLSKMMDNLLSYSLLTAGKYPIHKEPTNVIRLLRRNVANWYPVFEKASFQMIVEVDESWPDWYVDSQWFERVLDNLFQNIIRHADSGKYVKVQASLVNNRYEILIEDHGPGFDQHTNQKGAGIGLTIVNLMLEENKIQWEVQSSSEGTVIKLFRKNK